MQNGKKPPASDELNIALAKITGNDVTQLLISAYIEKAPENIRGLISSCLEIFYEKSDFSKQLSKYAYEVEKRFPGFTKGIYKEEELMREEVYRTYKELSKTLFKRHFNEDISISNEDRRYFHQKRNIRKPLKVPVLKTIRHNQSEYDKNNILEWTYIPNLWGLNENETILLKASDNSMADSRIYVNDIVVVKLCAEYNDGDTVVINVGEEDAIIKKIKKIDKETAWIYSTNSICFEPKVIDMKSVRIIGKVVQIMVNPV